MKYIVYEGQRSYGITEEQLNNQIFLGANIFDPEANKMYLVGEEGLIALGEEEAPAVPDVEEPQEPEVETPVEPEEPEVEETPSEKEEITE